MISSEVFFVESEWNSNFNSCHDFDFKKVGLSHKVRKKVHFGLHILSCFWYLWAYLGNLHNFQKGKRAKMQQLAETWKIMLLYDNISVLPSPAFQTFSVSDTGENERKQAKAELWQLDFLKNLV